MKYNPLTQELSCDDGTFIKQLNCPLKKRWETLAETIYLKGRLCDYCNQVVLDTSKMQEDELLTLVSHHPNTCLKIDLNQENLFITY
jgi:hypothetical protein